MKLASCVLPWHHVSSSPGVIFDHIAVTSIRPIVQGNVLVSGYSTLWSNNSLHHVVIDYQLQTITATPVKKPVK